MRIVREKERGGGRERETDRKPKSKKQRNLPLIIRREKILLPNKCIAPKLDTIEHVCAET